MKMTLHRHFLLTLLLLVLTCTQTLSQISFSTNWGSGKRSSVLGPGLEPGETGEPSWNSAKRANIFAPRDSESMNWGNGKMISLFGPRDSEANCFSRIEYKMLNDLVEIVKKNREYDFAVQAKWYRSNPLLPGEHMYQGHFPAAVYPEKPDKQQNVYYGAKKSNINDDFKI